MLFLINSFKKHSAISLFLASALLLTACGGGGGGGGGGGLPTRVTVVYPVDESNIDDASDDFEIAFVNDSVNPAGLLITLNGVDVTALFSPTSGTANRTASVYALSGILEQGTNYFNAKVGNSKVSGVTVYYDAKPGIILTEMTGAGSKTINGKTRKATFDSVTINDIMLATISPDKKSFSYALEGIIGQALPVTTTPDYTLIATDLEDGDTATTTLIVPQSTVKYGAAVQLNNSAFNVIESWVAEVMQNELNEVFAEFEAIPHADPADASSAYNDTGLTPLLGFDAASNSDCQFLNFVAASAEVDCKLFVSNVETVGTVTTDVQTMDSGSEDDKFPVKITVSFEQLNITIDNAAFDGSLAYKGALISTLQFGAGSAPNVVFTITVNVSKATGKIVEVLLPESSYTTLTLGTATAVNSSCNICTAGDWNALLSGVGSAATPTLQTQILAEVASALKPGWPALISQASPAVIQVPNTVSSYSLPDGTAVQLTTTGTLPTGLSTGTTYYVVGTEIDTVADPDTHTLKLAATPGGTAINTTSSGSGEHTLTTNLLVSVPDTTLVSKVKAAAFTIPYSATSISNASPAVVEVPYAQESVDALPNGTAVRLSTTGTLPAPLVANKTYYIVGTEIDTVPNPDTHKLKLALTPVGTAINTTSTGSGVHTLLIRDDVSSIKFALSGTEVTEAKSGSVYGGFIGLGGSTYADDSDYGNTNDVAALGSYFDPLNATEMLNKMMGTSNDVMIALSENSLNQLLLSVFQTQMINKKTIELKISDLGTTDGTLGKKIVDLSSLLVLVNKDIDYDDDVVITMGLEAVPHANFITGTTTSGLELNLYAVRIKVRVYRDGALTPVGGIEDTINLLVDVKAMLNYGLDTVTFLPVASIEKSNIVLNVVSVTSLDNILTTESVLQDFPAFIGSQIEDSVAELSKPIVQDLDLAGVGLFDKSAWLVLQDLKVDAEQEYILLKAQVVDTDPAPKKGLFQLNMLDSCHNADPIPVYCPDYVPAP